jgi:FtsP/CotA-like multicopper oxidase with cupredoxin domain
MISRPDVLKLSASVGLSTSFPAFTQDLAAPDYKIDIAPVTLELSPRHQLRTAAYNGQVPGPLLRFKENQPVTIEVANHTDRPEVIHWHGLFIPPDVDGATEEGTQPTVPRRCLHKR